MPRARKTPERPKSIAPPGEGLIDKFDLANLLGCTVKRAAQLLESEIPSRPVTSTRRVATRESFDRWMESKP